MPGPASLKRNEYYGFKGNTFWKILASVLKFPLPKTYDEKKQLLKTHHIALWDVIKSCHRKGSGDQNIKKMLPNTVDQLIHKYPKIKAIFLNGRTSEKFFKTHFYGITLPHTYLPSTSPAHASIPFHQKLKYWEQITGYL